MSLADTCDEIEAGLLRWQRYAENTYNARFELRYLLNTLVKLGEEQMEHAADRLSLELYRQGARGGETRMLRAAGIDIPSEQRFEELKKRVEGL